MLIWRDTRALFVTGPACTPGESAGVEAFQLYCGSYPKLLLPLPPGQAFDRITQFLTQLRESDPEELGSPLQSRLLKEQMLGQIASLTEVKPGFIQHLSRQTLSAGLLCGALDGAHLYLNELTPEAFALPPSLSHLAQEFEQMLEVADQYWRGLDLQSLEEQSRYGQAENLKSDLQDHQALSHNPSPSQLHRQFSETFRTGYGIGLIQAALSLLHQT